MKFETFKNIVESHNTEMTVYPTEDFRNKKTWGCSVVFNAGTPKESKVYKYNGTYENLALRLVKNSTCNKIINSIKKEIENAINMDMTFLEILCSKEEAEQTRQENIQELNNRLAIELAKEIIF